MRPFHSEVLSEIGQVLRTSKGNLILAKIKTPPKLGSPIYLKDGRKLGVVVDVFGPVSSPYALIRPSRDLSENEIIGNPIFLKNRRKRK